MPSPLEGYTVLDLSSMVLGPLAAQYLGDFGADVIKIEAPEGDLMRSIGPRRSPGMAAFFLNNNRNKRGIVLDLKIAEAREVFLTLVRRSDVLLHSVRADAAVRLGITYAELRTQNPKLIYCHVKGYSDAGLYAGRPAYDDVGQAQSGLAALQAVVAGEPRYMPTILADKVTAVHASQAVVAALLHRERTGQGQELHVPMFETMAAFNTVEHLWGEIFVPPLAPTGYVPISTASRRPFRTRDGEYICVLPYNQAHWLRFCKVVGDPGLTDDPKLATFAARQADQPGFWAEVGRRIAERDAADWLDALTKADIPCGRVNSIQNLLTDPHLESLNFWQTKEHPTEGTLRVTGYPIPFPASPLPNPRLPPGLGEHTDEIMRHIGLSAAEIEHLRNIGAFGRL